MNLYLMFGFGIIGCFVITLVLTLLHDNMKDNFHPANILRRLGSESPSFFKKIFTAMASLTGLCAAIIAIHSQYPDAHIPDVVDKWAGYGMVVGAVGGFMSKMTVKDPQNNDNQ